MTGNAEIARDDKAVPVVLCADDYGLSSAIGAAVRDLFSAGRLSATSCMTLSPDWPDEGLRLRDLSGAGGVGVHLTLTDVAPLTVMPTLAPDGRLLPLGELLKRAVLGRLPAAEVRAELEAQIDRFEEVMGRVPDHLDGHHHVHQLPVVRDVVFDLARRRLRPEHRYLRYCDEPLGAIVRNGVAVPRALLISALGRTFARRGRAQGFPGNRGFRGVRNFTREESPAALFDAYLRHSRPGMMIMCHPGVTNPSPPAGDSIPNARAREYAFLSGADFPDLLRRHGVKLQVA